MLQRLWTRMQSMVTRGVLRRTNDTTPTLTVQVELRFDEIADAIEYFQPFGVSFRPTADSEVIVLAAGASQDNLVAINATNRAQRPTEIEEGEGGLYTPTGWKVFCNKSDEVNLGEKVAADFVALAADVKRELDAIKSALDNHIHKVEVTGSATKQSGATIDSTHAYTVQAVAAEKVKAT